MTNSDRSRVIRLAEAQGAINSAGGEHTVTVLQRGTLDVRLAVAPSRPNQLTRHTQDEVYAIVRGRGVFLHDGRRDPFEAGDFLFVAAGTEHRFEDFSNDVVVWVVFYGPDGGEVPA